jgi:hypothetical protein
MAVNPYFKFTPNHQKLLDDLTVETIKITGQNIFYIPREFFKIDRILGEDVQSKFLSSYPVEAYILDVFKFDGQQDIITKYGIMNTDRLSIQISKTRFKTEVTKKKVDITRPREGDLIYFPLSKSIFEINKIEDEVPFYQLGNLYTYTLTLELFTYSQEEFDTGIQEVDQVLEEKREFVGKISLVGINGGNYLVGEIVSHSGYSANVYNFVKGFTSSTLLVNNQTGEFISGITLTGQISNSGYTGFGYTLINTIISTDLEREESDGDNLDFDRERAKKELFDFTFKDPFSNGEY